MVSGQWAATEGTAPAPGPDPVILFPEHPGQTAIVLINWEGSASLFDPEVRLRI